MDQILSSIGGYLGGGAAALGGIAAGVVLFVPDSCTLPSAFSPMHCVNMLGWDVFGLVGVLHPVAAVPLLTLLIGVAIFIANKGEPKE